MQRNMLGWKTAGSGLVCMGKRGAGTGARVVGEAGGSHTWPAGWMWEVWTLPRIGQHGQEAVGCRSTRMMPGLGDAALAG